MRYKLKSICIVITIHNSKIIRAKRSGNASLKGNKHGSVTSIAFVLFTVAPLAWHTAISLGLRAEEHQRKVIMDIKEKLASAKNGKKELTPKQQKVRTILNWIATAVCVVVIIFALVVAIFTIAGANDDHLTRFGDKIYMNVASDSMSPTFTPNDVLIADTFDKATNIDKIKVGQVVTFSTTSVYENARYAIYNTHRIVKLNYDKDGNLTSVVTRGDHQDTDWKVAVEELAKDNPNREIYGKTETVAIDAIVATWGDGETSGKLLKGCGAFSNWIQDTEHFGASKDVRFFCIVVLPLILLFVVYAFVLIRTLVIAKLENQRKVQAEQVVTVDSLSDEEKRRLAQEYLASLAKEQDGGEGAPNEEDTKEEPQQDALADDTQDIEIYDTQDASEDKE